MSYGRERNLWLVPKEKPMHSQISLDFQMKQDRIQGLFIGGSRPTPPSIRRQSSNKSTYPPFPSHPPPSPRDLAFAPTTVKNYPISEHRLRRWFGSFTTTRYLTHSPNIVTTSNPLMTTQLFSGNSSRYGTRNWTQPFQWDNNSMEPISFKIRIWPLDMFSNCNIELK